MRKKYVAAVLFTALGLSIAGVSAASAHGWGFGLGANATPEEVAAQQTEMFQHQADILGIAVDKVKDGWAQGKTLSELADENNVSEEQLQTRLQEQRAAQQKERLQTLVEQKVITQAQADARLKVMEEKFKNAPAKGMRHGMRGMHGELGM
ncbi:MAG: hypothetical protein WCV85_01680 [Patescibacteria group bacterium]|jgi:hypothetical protein